MKLRHLISMALATGAIALTALSASAQTYYVDAKANPAKANGSEEYPFTTIQKAADIVNPGDTVLVLPGIYYESVTITRTGTKDAPIVFRAVENGEGDTVVTCANKDIQEKKVQWTLEEPENNIYSIPYDRNVSNMMVNDARIVGYNSLEELRRFESWKGSKEPVDAALDGPGHGYWWDATNKKLYVHLADDERYHTSNPNENIMKVGGPYYDAIVYKSDFFQYSGATDWGFRKDAIGSESYCFGIITDYEDSYVTISGFTTEVPGWTGIFIRSQHVNVDNCWLRGAIAGIKGGLYGKQDRFITSDVSVTNCDFSMWPAWTDGLEGMISNVERGLGKYFFWVIKGGTNALHDAEAGGFLSYTGDNWKVLHNKIWECEDGLSYAFTKNSMLSIGNGATYMDVRLQDGGIELAYNRFERCLDNAIECEDHAINLDIHHNEFHDTYDSFSIQPLGLDPWPTNIYVHNNVWTASEYAVDTYENYTSMNYSWLKTGFPYNPNFNGTRYYIKTWPANAKTNYSIRPVWCDDKGIWIYNNYVNYGNGFTQEVVGSMWGEEYTYDNINIVNNIIMSRANNEKMQLHGESRRTFIHDGETLDSRDMGDIMRNNYCVATNADEEGVHLKTETVSSKIFASTDDIGITVDENGLYTVSEDSILVGNGWQMEFTNEDTTTVGALKPGEVWHIDYSPQLYGDVNRDKKVDIDDIELLYDKIGITVDDDDYEIHFDLDYNGIIDENDVAALQAEYLRVNG